MSANPSDRPFRVLVVDADDAPRALLTARLAGQDFEIAGVATDTQAYAALDAQAPALDALVVATDLGLGTTGFDVARHARRLNPEIAVIYLTHASRDSAERHGVPGAAYIARPFDPGLLVMVVKELAAR